MFPQELENESIYILREVAAQFSNPIILFSGGKDSLTLIRLAQKAFWPNNMPFKILHIDTGNNFLETIKFRDQIVNMFNIDLEIGYVQSSIDAGTAKEQKGPNPSRNKLQTITLLEEIKRLNADACIGGARRDEEKARAKERVFSIREKESGWIVENQRPELWNLYNGKIHKGQNVRVFPLSNWTELDVWNYIEREKLNIPTLYFSHIRKVFLQNGMLIPYSKFVTPRSGTNIFETSVRFRTVGDMTCTAAIESTAKNVQEVIDEITQSKHSERGSRLDDKNSDTAMEDRKKKGYF